MSTTANARDNILQKPGTVRLETVSLPSNIAVSSDQIPGLTTLMSNFNTSNDRNAAAVVSPTIAVDGSAVDHTLRTDGAADISFEWLWSGNEGDIDGFLIYVYQSSSSANYVFGTTEIMETVYTVPAKKRAFILYGSAANLYTTFGIQAYRAVDKDVSATGVIRSSLVKPALAAENPYQPSANVAFSGNVTGTVNSIPVANINDWAYISSRPADSAIFNSYLAPSIAAAGMTTFSPFKAWEFSNTTDGWSTGFASTTLHANSFDLTATSNDPNLYSPSGFTIDGSKYDKVRMRVRRKAGTGWQGQLYYSTASHSFSESYTRIIGTDPTIGGAWTIIEWDMADLGTTGSADWVSNTITGLRIDLGTVTGDSFEIDWASIGRYGVGSDEQKAILDAISSDNVLSKGEKPAVLKEYQAIDAEWATLIVQADALGVDRSDYNNAHQALSSYLVSLGSSSSEWQDSSKDTTIDGSVFRQKFTDCYNTKQKLINALAAKAATMATGVTLSESGVLTSPGGSNQGQVQALPVKDGARTTDYAPNAYGVVHVKEFKQCSSIGISTGQVYCTLETIKPWIDNSGGQATQWAYVSAYETWKRSGGCGDASWGPWIRDLDRSLFTGDLNATAGATWGTNISGQPTDISNLVKKGNFDDGNYGNWQVDGIENVQTGGSPYLKNIWMTRRDCYEIGSGFPVTPGEVIYCSAWFETTLTDYSCYLGARTDDKNGGTTNWNVGAGLGGRRGWTYVEGSFVVPANSTMAYPWIQMANGTGQGFSGQFLRAAGLWIGRHARGANYTTNTNQLSDGAGLGTTATWGGVSGTGKPADNATVGADATNFRATPGGDNLLPNSGFELYMPDNRPKGYGVYNNSAIACSWQVVGGRTGGRAFAIRADGGGASTFGLCVTYGGSGDDGVQGGVIGGWQPYKTYVLSFKAKKVNGGSWGNLTLRWNTQPATVVDISNPNLTTSWQTYALRITWGGTVEASGRLFIDRNGEVYSGDEIHIDEIMVQEGDIFGEWFPSSLDPNGKLSTSTPTSLATSVTLAPGGTVKSSNYVPGVSGFILHDDGSVEFGAAQVRGEITGSSIKTSVLAMESARLMNAYTRLAPFTIYDVNMQMATSITNCTVILGGFMSASYGNNNEYNAKRMTNFKMDVFLKATVTGDGGVEQLILDVAYNGGGYTQIVSTNMDLTNKSSFTVAVRYTTIDNAYTSMDLRARTINGKTLALTFEAQIFNFNTSTNAAQSNSGISAVAPPATTQPPTDTWCVDYETTLLSSGLFVRDSLVGDLIEVWNDDAVNPEIEMLPVRAIGFGTELSYLLRTASGAEIIQSKSTPMSLRDGRVVTTDLMLGEDVLVNRKGTMVWEPVVALDDVGVRKVVKVNLGDRMYFAGKDSGATIATHNMQYKP